MRIIEGLVTRNTFRNEADFKRAVVKTWQQSLLYRVIELENEEKAPGMPDVLLISQTLPAILTEFKIASINGYIKFQKTQPLFYRQNRGLLISILAWDTPWHRAVLVEPSDVTSLSVRIPVTIDKVDSVHDAYDWYKLHI
jgi:hypothetical protein